MGRQTFNDGQEIVLADLNNITKNVEQQFYDRYLKELVQKKVDAFFDDGLKASYANSTTLNIAPGLGIQEDSSAESPEPTMRPIFSAETEAVNITTPHASLDRIDILVVKSALVNGESETRKFKDAISDTVSNQSFVTTKDWGAEFLVVAGTADVSPVAPSTPAGYIKIATLAVTAVTGMAGSGAVTDNRALMPVGGESLLDTLGYERLTAGSAVALSTLLAEVDTFLKNGVQNYTDYEDLGDDPEAPEAGFVRRYYKDGIAFQIDENEVVSPLGSGGGGGGGLRWNPTPGAEPVAAFENGELVYLFDKDSTQSLSVWFKVPSGYVSGRQLSMNLAVYSPSTSNNVLMRTTSTLIRKNNDAVTSTTNQHTSINTELTISVANRYREISCDLTDAAGLINSVAVTAGDLIKVVLSRVSGSESVSDTAETRFIPSATEVNS